MPREEQEVSDLVCRCLDNQISSVYSQEVISSLKKMYHPERILEKLSSQDNDGWSARTPEDELLWVMGLEHDREERETEIKMFYGLPGLRGARGAQLLLATAVYETKKRDHLSLTGKVLQPARIFIQKMADGVGKLDLTGPFTVEEIDPETGIPFYLDVMHYNLTFNAPQLQRVAV